MQDYEILKSCSIRDGTLLLLKDIQHIYSDPISLKSTTFFSNLTEILYTIFGDEKNPGWLEKAARDALEVDSSNFRRYQSVDSDLRALIDLLSPYRDKNANLFTLMSEHLTESKYLLNESKLPQFTQLLIASRSYDHHILQEYKKLFQHFQDPKNGSFKFDLILSPFEFYLFVFIYSMKKFQSKSMEPKTPEDYENNDLVTGLACNPYLILLRKYLEYFRSEMSWNQTQKTYFRKLTFLIEDYFIHDIIHSSPQTFSKFLPPTQQPKFYQIKTVKRQDFISKKIPCPHIHYAIYLMLHYLQKILSPFNEDSQACHFLLGMSIEEARSKYARLTYNYILNCLRYWTKDLNNSSNLADLGYVWLKYIRPWDILPPNLVDDLSNYEASRSMNDSLSQVNILRDFRSKDKVTSEEKDYCYLSHKELFNTVNSYILRNLGFYTVLLKEFIIVFSEINNFSFKEINFFQECIGLFFHYTEKYNMDPYFEFLDGHITFENLRNLSLGPKKRLAPTEIIERHIEEIGADYADLYFINDEAIKMRIVKLKDKFNKYLTSLLSTRKNQRDRYEPIIAKLSRNMEKIISILYSTFDIRTSHTQPATATDRQRLRPEGIRNSHLYDTKARLSDPWLKPVGSGDFVILYWIFYFIAKMYDKYVRLIPIEEREDELYRPTLRIRGFSRKMNVYRFAAVALVLYLILKIFL